MNYPIFTTFAEFVDSLTNEEKILLIEILRRNYTEEQIKELKIIT